MYILQLTTLIVCNPLLSRRPSESPSQRVEQAILRCSKYIDHSDTDPFSEIDVPFTPVRILARPSVLRVVMIRRSSTEKGATIETNP